MEIDISAWSKDRRKRKFVSTTYIITWIELLIRMLYFFLNAFDYVLDIRLFAILQLELKVSLL